MTAKISATDTFKQKENELLTGLANPAKRALANAGIQSLKQLAKFSEAEIKQLHGIGPNALKQLRRSLKAKRLSFADEKDKR